MEKAWRSVKPGLRAPAGRVIAGAMDAKSDRDRRLAEALRANLRRRKAQARDFDPVVDPEKGVTDPTESEPPRRSG